MKLKELNLSENELMQVSKKLELEMENVLDLEIHVEYDGSGMVKWLYDEEHVNKLIDDLSKMEIKDISLSLLDNLILNNKSIVIIGDYVLFFYL